MLLDLICNIYFMTIFNVRLVCSFLCISFKGLSSLSFYFTAFLFSMIWNSLTCIKMILSFKIKRILLWNWLDLVLFWHSISSSTAISDSPLGSILLIYIFLVNHWDLFWMVLSNFLTCIQSCTNFFSLKRKNMNKHINEH